MYVLINSIHIFTKKKAILLPELTHSVMSNLNLGTLYSHALTSVFQFLDLSEIVGLRPVNKNFNKDANSALAFKYATWKNQPWEQKNSKYLPSKNRNNTISYCGEVIIDVYHGSTEFYKSAKYWLEIFANNDFINLTSIKLVDYHSINNIVMIGNFIDSLKIHAKKLQKLKYSCFSFDYDDVAPKEKEIKSYCEGFYNLLAFENLRELDILVMNPHVTLYTIQGLKRF